MSPKNNELTHTDSNGKASMVDVGHKNIQRRTAKASGFIKLTASTVALIKQNEIKKGDVLTLAEVAGIQGAKHTPTLIPLCHPLMLTSISVKAVIEEDGIRVYSETRCNGQTGVEMEALTAVNIALLTIYDMCKAVDKTMKICDIKLLKKNKEDII